MREKRLRLFAAAALVLVALGAVPVVRGLEAEPVERLEIPALRPAPAVAAGRATSGEPGGERPHREREKADRIGSFQAPDRVPAYEILEKSADERAGARALRLLVDTRARGEEDFTLIARELKARYAGYDAVAAQFTDATDVLSYNGGALISNTYAGAEYLGYIYGPPNPEGIYVVAE